MINSIEENPLTNIISDGGYTAIFRTIGIIGDSLSSGEHESLNEDGKVGYHDYYEYSWGQFMARACGLTAYNFSVGGLTAKEFQRLARYMKCFTPEKACQGYIIALGVNDLKDVNFHYSGGFGTMPDFENKDDTLIGAYVQVIRQIRDLQPKARIFVVTPPVRHYEDGERIKREERFSEFLRSLPQYFEFLYVIDLICLRVVQAFCQSKKQGELVDYYPIFIVQHFFVEFIFKITFGSAIMPACNCCGHYLLFMS